MKNDTVNSQKPTQKIWAIGGGKGGVGKSLIATNLSVILASLGNEVVAVDLDLGNANMHTCLGIRYPRKTLTDFLNGSTNDLSEILTDTSIYNLKFISGSGGIMGAANPWHTQKLKLLRNFEKLHVDDIVLDLGAGTTYNTIDFYLGATDHIIVAIPETISIQSAYNFLRICIFRKLHAIFNKNNQVRSLIEKAKSPTPDDGIASVSDLLEAIEPIAPESFKEFSDFLKNFRPKLILNMVANKDEDKLGWGLQKVINRYLGITVDYVGYISHDKVIRESLTAEIPFVINAPKSRPSYELFNIIPKLLGKSSNAASVREMVLREITRTKKTYGTIVVEAKSADVDPSIYVTDKVKAYDTPTVKETSSFSFIQAATWSKIAIDIGSSTTQIFVKGRGVMLNEPSLMSIDENTGKIVAIGRDAKAILGRSHSNIKVVAPMESGAITDFSDVQRMIQEFIKLAKKTTILIRPRVILTIPLGLTNVEKKAVHEFVNGLGARETHLVYEPFAAAIGCGLPVDIPLASMLVNLGGGSTSAIITSLSGIVTHTSDRVGSRDIDNAIIRYLRDQHNFSIGFQTAEWVKINFGQAMKINRDRQCSIRGQDLTNSIPKTLSISTAEIREAIIKPVKRMLKVVMNLLEIVPPELSGDLVNRGMTLAGGGALLQGIDKLIAEETGIKVRVAPNALTAAVDGAGRMLDDIKFHGRFFVTDADEKAN